VLWFYASNRSDHVTLGPLKILGPFAQRTCEIKDATVKQIDYGSPWAPTSCESTVKSESRRAAFKFKLVGRSMVLSKSRGSSMMPGLNDNLRLFQGAVWP
jgi:hypothetical protein